MGKANFENLRIYQFSEQLADMIWLIVEKWKHFERDTVGKQIVRSADSVGANIAEGAGRYTFKENKRFAHISRGSLYETKYWLRRAYKRNLLSNEQVDEIKPLIDELAPKLNAYINSFNKKKPTNDEQRTTNK